ncbi:family 16 glycosylhydrolase [Cocleimonas sp. KMM 6892]|uniref:glycoside hydrolase family 16 protein n=1 Tax=unclassified Cocleimonas TaxID=2639732 RepID=UPI002DBE3267|nr:MULTISPECIES: family 16 glycosylhydrolase [unclassified Cocleimonas]MEB8433271.1 family 16 glycosylhydrolase [Cocleimonas sp. KMM 6892]MEC4715748.1 family 16 glycosylhydrolase [Cocleimonas sp. KMM 6895]MEC4745209.1 family 16 glycosylhydrolase [Cocleimonas sp. KMM 6896]
MKNIHSLAILGTALVLSQTAFAQPSVNGNTISWPADGHWYQVQNPSKNQWNLCSSSKNLDRQCEVENGNYVVIDHTIQKSYNIKVPSGQSSQLPTVSGSTISWPLNGDWYQVQRPEKSQWNLCSSSKNKNGKCANLDDGNYLVINHSTGVKTKLVVGNYSQIFREDFSGNSISSKFKLANWSIPNRDTTNNINSCSQSGGKLNLSIKNVGNQRQACYLLSKKSDFGPGSSSTLKVEVNANVSQVKAKGAWFAGWLYAEGRNANGTHPSEDNNPITGMEIDIVEYMRADNRLYQYVTAIHDGAKEDEWIQALDTHGINLTQNKYHTFSVEWNKECIAYFIDGKKVSTKNSSLISSAKKHSLKLTMEGQTGTQWGWPVGSLQNNLRDHSATAKVDWVKVSEKNSIDSNLCN